MVYDDDDDDDDIRGTVYTQLTQPTHPTRETEYTLTRTAETNIRREPSPPTLTVVPSQDCQDHWSKKREISSATAS